ncbi:hypothetical protein [Cognatiyoonia sp.]
MKYIFLATIALFTTACTPARIAADAAVTTGQVVLGAADMLL